MRRLKILVADDEAIIRLGLKAMLMQLGHEVLLAVNGREALEFARSTRPDLALLDINMPLTDGLEAAKVIARKHPMPILVLTAYSEQEMIERATQLPIQGYLVKPVNERDLAAAIGVAMARFEDAQKLAREKAELQDSLETRKVVERAKGMLVQQGLNDDDAYQALQLQAREQRITLRQAAEAILAKGGRRGP